MPQASTLKQWLEKEPFSLAMSSGFFGFFTHCGLLSALVDNGLQPQAVMGSSAGALTTGIYASGVAPAEMRERLFEIRKSDFWDPRPGLGLLKGRKFRGLIESMIAVKRIEDCPIPLRISVYNTLRHRTEVLSEGDLASAIQASCTVPLMFHPVWINRRPYLDGGILDRPGLFGAAEGERIFYHHLSSKSAWRRKNGAHTRYPLRDNLITATIDNPPRPSPNDLTIGQQAYRNAYDKMTAGLTSEVSNIIHF